MCPVLMFIRLPLSRPRSLCRWWGSSAPSSTPDPHHRYQHHHHHWGNRRRSGYILQSPYHHHRQPPAHTTAAAAPGTMPTPMRARRKTGLTAICRCRSRGQTAPRGRTLAPRTAPSSPPTRTNTSTTPNSCIRRATRIGRARTMLSPSPTTITRLLRRPATGQEHPQQPQPQQRGRGRGRCRPR